MPSTPRSPDAATDLASEFDEAAARWRATATKQRAEGGVSSMCGEEGIPSHVLSTARAMTFEYAAKCVKEAEPSDDPR